MLVAGRRHEPPAINQTSALFGEDEKGAHDRRKRGTRKDRTILHGERDSKQIGHFRGKCVRTHSLRRANITWRQEVGASSIEASCIAGQSSTKITEEYTIVQLKRQEDLTRRLQARRTKAGKRVRNNVVVIKPEVGSVA